MQFLFYYCYKAFRFFARCGSLTPLPLWSIVFASILSRPSLRIARCRGFLLGHSGVFSRGFFLLWVSYCGCRSYHLVGVLSSCSLRSKRFRASSSRKVGTRAKKKELRGRGGERRRPLLANPTIFKNCIRPQTQLLIGAVLLRWLLSTRNINQTRCVLFYTCATDLVLFDLWSQIRIALDWFESCLCEGL